jgi:hypothetical protein
MITIRDFMETVEYRITEGCEYGWKCFGKDAFQIDSWNGDIDGYTVSIVFDNKTQVVYQAAAYDYKLNRFYRLFNPVYKQAYLDEAAARNVNANEAVDDINYIDLEVDEDFLNKASAIVRGEDYDTRVTITLDFPDDELLKYMIAAHEQDMKFNDFVELALTNALELHKDNQ